MALNVNAALMQLDPLKPLASRPDKQESMERERLKLMREQFEEVKRKNVQDEEWRKIAEAGEMTRAQLMLQKQREQDAAAAAAKTVEARRAAYDSLMKRVDTGDYEGMEMDATQLNELGGLAERTGEDENGFPSWRIELDAEAARQRDAEQEEQAAPFFSDEEETPAGAYGSMEEGMSAPPRLPRESTAQSLDRMSALGYDTLGLRGNMAGTGVGEGPQLSTEDAFRSAQRAARGPDEPAPAAPAEPALDPNPPGALSDIDIADGATAAPPGLEDTGVSAYDYAGEADAAKNFAEPGRSTPMAPPPGLEPSIFQATGRPARGPDQRDIMGSVPKNVIDTGSMADQRKQRLGPVMASIEASMPKAYRDSARAADEAALASGLPAEKALAMGFAQRGQSAGLVGSELEAERKKKEEIAKVIAEEKLSPLDQQKLVKFGRDSARQSFQDGKIKDSIGVMEGADQVKKMLEDGDKANDTFAVNLMMDLAKQVGAQSDADALRLTGGKISVWSKVKEWMHEQVEGGFGDEVAAAMKGFAADMRERQRVIAFGWMESTHEDAESAEHPLVGKGYDQVLDKVPAWLKKEYNDYVSQQDDEEEAPEAGGTGGAGAGAGYTPPVRGAADGPPIDDYEQAIPKESRIAYVHKNPGNLMYDKDNPAGAEPGEDKEGGGKWARFPTVQAGFEALRGYITRHDDETIHDFIARYAPASDGNDTEKYIADAVRELKAEPDDTVYNIDPYDLMRFIVRHESGTNMPYAYDKRDAELAEFEKKNPAPADETPAEPLTSTPGPDDHKLEGLE